MSHLRPTERFVWMADPIKGSRFEAWIQAVHDADDAARFLEQVRATHPNATHHCWAWVLSDGTRRHHDDGEPGGSAGAPILAQLQGHGCGDTMAVVVRWYGGTKLGVGGLIRAYGGTAGKALDRAPLETVTPTTTIVFLHAYALTQRVDAALATAPDASVQRDHQAEVRVTVTLPIDHAEDLRSLLVERTSGRIQLLGCD